MTTRQITMNGMLRILRKPPKVKSIVLTSRTTPELLKKGRETGKSNDFGTIYHIQRTQALLGTSYEDMVNESRIRAMLEHLELSGDIPEFKAEALWNGRGVHDGLYTVRHKIKRRRYLYFYPIKQGEGRFVNERGEEISEEELGEFLKLRYEPKTIHWRTVALENIAKVEYANKLYNLVLPKGNQGILEDHSEVATMQ